MIVIEEKKSIKGTTSTSLFLTFKFDPAIICVLRRADAIWHAKQKVWELPPSRLAELIDELTFLDDIEVKLLNETNEPVDELTPMIKHKLKPFDYQEEGIKWLINHPNSLLLDTMGLGKTLQIIYACEELKKQRGVKRVLIICCLNLLKQNWKKEILKCSTESCRVVGEHVTRTGNITYKSTKEKAAELAKPEAFFSIVNIEALREKTVIDAIKKGGYDVIVVDEVHRSSNPSSAQGKNFLKLCNVGDYHYCLTGTLLVNSPIQSYSALKFIKQMNSNFSTYKTYYTEYDYSDRYPKFKGYRNLSALQNQISSCSLRRTKELLNLPEKVIVPEFIEMGPTQSKFYTELQKGIVTEADRVNIKTTSLLGLTVRLRQATSCPELLTSSVTDNTKLDRAVELIEDIVGLGEKVVVYSDFKAPLYELYRRIHELCPVYIGTGDNSDDNITKSIDEFQTKEGPAVFIATISKISAGITLTGASYMIFLDCPWTDADYQQACDRIHRIGTTKTVFIYNLISTCQVETVDERVQRILERKKAVSDYVVDNIDPKDELKELLGVNLESTQR